MTRSAKRTSLVTLAATIVVVVLLPLSACQGDVDESGFLKHTERAVVNRRTEAADSQWWQANQDRVLSEAWASCKWLEGQPEVGDEGQGPEEWVLRQQYLHETQTLQALDRSRRFYRTVVEFAWAFLCNETRNSRTSLPRGAYED